MIITIDGSKNADHRPFLEAMFKARKQVFVDLLGWDLEVTQGHYEIDTFDNESAQYLILTDSERRHLGSTRLLATTGPHILGDLFAELCDQPPPRGSQIYEITRFCLGLGLGAAHRRLIRDSLVTALVRHALDRHITTYTGVAEINWLHQIMEFGWRCAPLGKPRLIGGKQLGALRIDIGPDTLDRLGRSGITSPNQAAVTREAA